MQKAHVSESRCGGEVSITITGATAEDVLAARQNYESNYPKMGYETRIYEPGQQGDGTFAAYGKRRASCD